MPVISAFLLGLCNTGIFLMLPCWLNKNTLWSWVSWDPFGTLYHGYDSDSRNLYQPIFRCEKSHWLQHITCLAPLSEPASSLSHKGAASFVQAFFLVGFEFLFDSFTAGMSLLEIHPFISFGTVLFNFVSQGVLAVSWQFCKQLLLGINVVFRWKNAINPCIFLLVPNFPPLSFTF